MVWSRQATARAWGDEMTRRWLPATAALRALTGLATALGPAGCGARPAEPAPTPAAPTRAVTGRGSAMPSDGPTIARASRPRLSDPAAAARFVAVVRDRLPEIAGDRRDGEISLIAERACAGLGAGRRADEVVASTRSLGTMDAEATDESTARRLIELAIDTVCPRQVKRVHEF